MKESIILILILLLLGSCKEDHEVSPFNGIWQQQGYGKILEIKNDSVKVYDMSAIDCTLYSETLLADEGEVLKFTGDSIIIKKNIKIYEFTRLQELPQLCQD
jgi:carboxyl-terminal processing protease